MKNLNLQKNFAPYVALFLVAGSLLSLEVTLTRMFSIMIWYHFAYLIIGVALLGGGAAGTFLAVRQWDAETISKRLAVIGLLLSLGILLILLVINVVQFDPLDSSASMLLSLFGITSYFSVIFLVYFLGGLVIAGIFRSRPGDAHSLYFADLLGAGISALVILWMIQKLTGPGSMVFAAILVLLACFALQTEKSTVPKSLLIFLLAGELVLLVFVVKNPINLPIPRSKELGRFLTLLAVDEPDQTIWNPVARVDVMPTFESDAPWVIGNVSSSYVPQQAWSYRVKFATLDGTSMTVLYEFDGDFASYEFLDHTIISAPYQLSFSNPRVLNIGVGGGLDIILARKYGASDITAVELNSDLVKLIESTHSEFVGNLSSDPNTHIIVDEGRSFMIRTSEKYDIIQGIGLDNFAALNGGAYVLSESYLYTVDAIELALSRLAPNGVFSWTRTVYTPPREMLRLSGVVAEALRRKGIEDPSVHILIVASEDGAYATLLASHQPFDENIVSEFRKWAAENRFPILHDPLLPVDTLFSEYLLSDSPRAFEEAYSFNIFPVTDNNPFFYNYFKWTNLTFIFSDEGDINLRFPLGNLVILAMFAFSVVTAATFIIYPLLKYKRDGLSIPYALPMLFYFSLLGVAYIMIEIILIQRFTLFIGYPSRAIAITIFGMLVFSALGSLLGRKFITSLKRLRLLLAVLALTLLVYLIGLVPLLRTLQGLSEWSRIGLSILIISPLGLVMGIPFPTGLYQLGNQARDLIPWAWGVNGVFSVLGSVLVILISMENSFTVAFGVATTLYMLAHIMSPYLWKTQIIDAK